MVTRKTRLQSMLDESRGEFRRLLLHETAELANSLSPEHRQAARGILGATDFVKFRVKLDGDTTMRIRSVRKVIDGNNRMTDAFAREIAKDEEIGETELKKKAAKLVSVGSVLLIRRHNKDPRTGPNEKELMDALENLDDSLIAPMQQDLIQLARRSPFESVKRAAMAILARMDEI